MFSIKNGWACRFLGRAGQAGKEEGLTHSCSNACPSQRSEKRGRACEGEVARSTHLMGGKEGGREGGKEKMVSI